MVTAPSAVLMSIKPGYSEAILAGRKTVELRRRRPSFGPGTRVLIYATAPKSRVIGMFETGDVLEGPPETLWQAVQHRACVDPDAYDSYFDGCERSFAIEVARSWRLDPVALSVRAPQSYMLLRDTDPRHHALLSLTAAPDPTPGLAWRAFDALVGGAVNVARRLPVWRPAEAPAA